MFSKYVAKFPHGYNPSNSQITLLKEIEKAYRDGYKYVIVSAPTGTGKSFIPRTLGNIGANPTKHFKDLINSYDAYRKDQHGNYIFEKDCLGEPAFGTFALTITKQLQDQYKLLFDDIEILKGKQNYICTVDESFDVDTAPCIHTPKLKNECWAKNSCTYFSNRNNSLSNPFAVLNYKMFMALPNHVKRRNFIVCDEASELEEELVRRFSAEIDYKRLDLYNIEYSKLRSEKYDIQYRWLINLIFVISEKVNELTNKNSSKINVLSLSEANKLKYLKMLHGDLTTVEQTWHKCEYVVDTKSDRVSFTPLKIDNLSKHIFDYGDNILLMSATITDHEQYAKVLGIKKYKYIESPSAFDPGKSPVYLSSKPVLNYQNLQKFLPIIAKNVQDLCDHHKDEKGIVHTHSLEICNYLQTKLIGDRFLFREQTATNEKILKEHFRTSKPTVLVSPSLGFGTDLNAEMGRFQIIVKTPYPPLSNKRIKKMFDMDKDWYSNKTLCALVQTTGRCTRSKADYAVTYVLDGKARALISQNKTKLPKHFIERLV